MLRFLIHSSEAIIASIRNKLFSLPYATTVLSGHGPVTTLAEEMANNPYVGLYHVCFK